jgi:Lipocalin-like domain
MLMFSPAGHYSAQFERANLPKIKSNEPEKATPEEAKAITGGTLAHFGDYTVNEADKTFTKHIHASSFPNWNGTKQVRKITALTDDVLTFNVANPSAAGAAGDIAQIELVWQKVK